MTTVAESRGAPTEFGAGLQEGVNTVSQDQTITFTQYVRVVLPLDGYVFWVNASLLREPFLFNFWEFNAATYGLIEGGRPPITLIAEGSLHYSSDAQQNESDSATVNPVIFTAEQEIKDLNAIAPNVMYVGVTPAGTRFAFSRRTAFYQQADLWHYKGDALYSTMGTQIIDTLADLAEHELIVSNSLPLFLAMWSYQSPYPMPGALPDCPIYPSFAVPENIAPPYVTVHIPPRSSRALQSAPWLDTLSDSYQLGMDSVDLTLRGLRNNAAIDFLNYLLQYSRDTNTFGLMSMPFIRDEKDTQKEFGILAQKKVIPLDVSYNQTRLAEVSRQLILEAFITATPNNLGVN
jgi:hypothetical protein